MGTVRSELLHTTHQPCINSLSLLLCWLLAALRSPSTLPALLVSPILVLPAWPILILTLTISLWSTLPPLPPPSSTTLCLLPEKSHWPPSWLKPSSPSNNTDTPSVTKL